MHRRFGLRTTCAVAAIVSLLAGTADAQTPPPASSTTVPARREPTAGDLATARTALREGLSLREHGNLQGSLARLASAYDLVPTPVTGFELGKAHMMLGHVLQAHELFMKVLRMPPSLEESSRSQVSREESARLARELEPRIPSLRLKLTLPEGASAVVRLDDEVIPLTGTETQRAVDPGAHEIIARAGDGPEEKQHVEIAESETKEIALAPKWVAPKPPPAPEGHEVVIVRQTDPLAFVGFGVAAAALVVTSISALVWVNARDDVNQRCGTSYCPPGANGVSLTPSAVVDRNYDSDKARYQISGAMMIAAGFTTVVFVGVGVVGAARPVRERVTAGLTLRPAFGPSAAGLAGTF